MTRRVAQDAVKIGMEVQQAIAHPVGQMYLDAKMMECKIEISTLLKLFLTAE